MNEGHGDRRLDPIYDDEGESEDASESEDWDEYDGDEDEEEDEEGKILLCDNDKSNIILLCTS